MHNTTTLDTSTSVNKKKVPVLDEATSTLLKGMAESGAKPIHLMTVEEARTMSDSLGTLYGEGPAMARVEEEMIPTTDGFINIRILIPTASPKSIIVYYHGGGWVLGQINGFETLGRILAQRTESAVVLVNYRKAPEHAFPIPINDAYTALEWVSDNKHRIAGANVPLIVAGDSAGGNLSAVTALRARDRQGPEIAMQVLVYPVTDFDTENASYLDPAKQLFLDRKAMLWFWDHYMPDVTARQQQDASPLRATDLSDLPPAVVLTAEFDPLRDEGEAYAARLMQAGVPVTFRRFHDQMHGFFTMPNLLPGAEQGIRFVTEAINAFISKN